MESRFEDYHVLSVIGTGTFGTCYKVQNKNSGEIFVWKAIDYGKMTKEKKLLLVSEVNLLSELRHSNIVRYYDRILHKATATLYIIMEWCEGGDLATLIDNCRKSNKCLEESFVWRVLYQTGRALQACHSYLARGTVMHRDIKPANVFLDGAGNVKLGDFGLARVLQGEANYAQTVVGTPYYMSPEMIRGGKYNKKSDIWSLGCLVYEMCVLMPPFKGPTIPELAQRIEGGRFKRIPSHYSEDLQKIISFMLRVDHVIRPTVEVILHHPTVMSHLTQDSFKVRESILITDDESMENKLEERLDAIKLSNPISEEGACGIEKIRTDDNVKVQDSYLSKVEILRQREAAVRGKELAVSERETAVEKREKHIGLLSRMIKEKMARANVYLHQCRDSRSISSSNRNLQQKKHPSILEVNLDTSFSADPGDTSIRPTSAKLKPEEVEKPAPFRRSSSLGRHVHFGTLPSLNPNKYSTIPEHSDTRRVSGTWHKYPEKGKLQKENIKPPTHTQIKLVNTQQGDDKIDGYECKDILSEGFDKAVEDNFRNGILSMLNSNRTSSESSGSRNGTLPRDTAAWRERRSAWLENKRIAYSTGKLNCIDNKENVETICTSSPNKRKLDGSVYNVLTKKVGSLTLR